MLRMVPRLIAILAGMLLLSGCHAPAEPEGRTVSRVTAPGTENYDRLWEAAAHSLRKQYFTLDRQDRGEGIITTRAETSASWFELWRPQPEPGYYWWESNIQTIQRQATVTIRPSDLEGGFDVDVQVERLRYSLPERQIDNSAAAQRIFSGAAPTEEGRMERPSTTGQWMPVGRDEFAERRILNSILTSYAGPLTAESLPAQ